MNDANDTLPVSDDMSSADQEQALLDAVMANSPIMEELDVPLPEEQESDVPDPEESDEVEDDLEESEEAVSEDEEEEYEEEVDEAEVEDAADEAATQDTDVFTADDLDLDAKVLAKIDGEEVEVSFGDLIKGYQTDSHLSKKGRELSEAQKAFEEERANSVKQLDDIAQASAAMIMQGEQALAKAYHDVEAQIQQARDNGDTYEVNELKDKREQVQKQYWNARNQREAMVKQVQEQKAAVEAEQWNKQIEHFTQEIPNLIPDFNEEVAGNIRQFAIDEGINPDILDQITDPVIVKFVDDYRRLKQGVAKGTAKRKAVPAKKAVPTKKAKPAKKKAEDKAKMVKARAMREDASQEDQMAFLRQHASKTLKL